MADLIYFKNFINGEFVDPTEGAWLDSEDPSTAEVFAKVADSGQEDVERAVQAANEAFPAWAALDVHERSRFLNRIADAIEANLEEFAVAESKDQGKPVSLARRIDIPRAVYNFRFFAGAVLHHEDMATHSQGPFGDAVNYTVNQPVGVAGLISPWNLPLYLLTWKIAPALATGNTIVAKPSEMTSYTAWKLCSVLQSVGLPKGVVNMVFGTGPRAGSHLVRHPQVPLISFTGGTATGEVIQRDSAAFCKKLSLELGGKNPNIVFADAQLDEAVVNSVRAAFTNQGEVCLCGSRLFVERPIYEEFVERFIAETKKIVVGDPRDANSVMGALVSKQHMDKVLYYINLAREEGGTIAFGGDRPALEGKLQNGYFVNPTVITGLAPSSRVQQEEIFGPVVTIWPFDTEKEVVGYANTIRYGLSSSIWTQNIERANRVAMSLQAGTVWVNCWMNRDLRVPFGGSKHSGIGREGGKFSLDFFTEQKTICVKYSSKLQ